MKVDIGIEELTPEYVMEVGKAWTEHILSVTPTKELLKNVPTEELLKNVSLQDRLKGQSADTILKGLSKKQKKALLAALTRQ